MSDILQCQAGHPRYAIRPATPDDAIAIRRMQAQSWRDTYVNPAAGVSEAWIQRQTAQWFTPEQLAELHQTIRHICADTEHNLYQVALLDGQVVGFIHASRTADGKQQLNRLYTARHTHGTGLAQQLMARADQWFGRGDVMLEVVAYNTRAIRFYHKAGFAMIDTPMQPPALGNTLPLATMIRKGGGNQ